MYVEIYKLLWSLLTSSTYGQALRQRLQLPSAGQGGQWLYMDQAEDEPDFPHVVYTVRLDGSRGEDEPVVMGMASFSIYTFGFSPMASKEGAQLLREMFNHHMIVPRDDSGHFEHTQSIRFYAQPNMQDIPTGNSKVKRTDISFDLRCIRRTDA